MPDNKLKRLEKSLKTCLEENDFVKANDIFIEANTYLEENKSIDDTYGICIMPFF